MSTIILVPNDETAALLEGAGWGTHGYPIVELSISSGVLPFSKSIKKALSNLAVDFAPIGTQIMKYEIGMPYSIDGVSFVRDLRVALDFDIIEVYNTIKNAIINIVNAHNTAQLKPLPPMWDVAEVPDADYITVANNIKLVKFDKLGFISEDDILSTYTMG